MQQVALAWLVYRLTRSPLALGAVAFAGDIAGVAVALFGGVLADRLDPYRIVLTTQTLAMLQAVLLAALVITGHITITLVIVLACLLGLVNGIDVPARQVFVLQLVDRKHLGNAIVLTSLALDSARMIGPSVGGAIIARAGEWPCFALNAASYLVVIVALLVMRFPVRSVPARPDPETLLAGVRHAITAAPIRWVLLVVAVVGFAGGPYAVLMPIMAADVLGGGPRTLGLLLGSIGVGALAGALFLGQRRAGYDRLVGVGAALFGASLLLFALSRRLSLSVPLLAVAGFGVMILMNSSHTLLLLLADQDKRGRVMSLFTLSFMATVPLGSLLAGGMATFVGAPAVIGVGGTVCAAGGVFFLLRLPALRREHPRLSAPAAEAGAVPAVNEAEPTPLGAP